MERSEESSKNCKGNQVTLVKPNILRLSCMSVIEDGNIPEWLLVEVLFRLPVKSVFRFKLVSKKWLSVISDPYFVRLYVSRASWLSSQPWTIVALYMYHKDSQISHLDYELLKDLHEKPSLCVVRVPSIHQPQEGEKYLIGGISNGLAIYWRLTGVSMGYADRYYYICNPLTGHCIALPPLACRLELCGWGFHTRVEDGFLKSYRMVLVDPPTQESNRLKFQVYVSEIGEWKDFNVPSNLFPVYIDRGATVVNGILHWIAEGQGIIAYDPYQNPESMRVIAFPGDIVGHNECNSLCVEDGGKLRYFEVGDLLVSGVAFPSFKVWVLNDYSSGEWYLQHNISHVDVQYDANFPSERVSIEPMCFHPFDSDIMYLDCDDVCVSYNIRTRKLQVEDEFFRHREDVLKRPTISLVYSFLFVIPHWPTSIPRPSYGAIEG